MAGVLLAEAGAVDQRPADARCESRSRTAWPASPRRARAASRRCRGRCGRGRAPPGRREAPRCSLPACAARDRQAANPAGLDPQVDDARAEADLAAEALDLGAHLLDHADQPEGADVRLGDAGDLLGRAGLDELLDHLARQMARVADLAPELAVGKGAGAALAELDVRFGIEHAAPPQAPGVAGALAHRAAALEDDRAKAHLRQQQGGEEAAGPEADDHRPHGRAGGEVGRRLGDEAGSGCRARGGRADRARGGRAPRPRRRPRSRRCRRRRSPRACARRSRA